MEFRAIHHEVDPSDAAGRTYREINLSIPHRIPIGTLVEIMPYEDGEHTGCRLFVVHHSRDCDGAPLYALSWDRTVDTNSIYAHVLTGLDGDDLRVVYPQPVFVDAYPDE